MVDAKADWLYTLKQWDNIFDEDTRKRLYKEEKASHTIRNEKKVEEMIHVLAEVVSINSVAVRRISNKTGIIILEYNRLYRIKIGIVYFL